MAVSVKAIRLWHSEIASEPGAPAEIHSRWFRSFPVSGQPPMLGKRALAAKKSRKKK